MEFLKDVFGDKALNFEEFETALQENKDVKLANLASGQYVDVRKFTDEQKEVTRLKDELKKFEDVDLNDLNTKITTLESELQNKDKTYMLESLVNKESFTSASAKMAFLSELQKKELDFKENEVVGYDEFKKEYMEKDPEAFKGKKEMPKFSSGTHGAETPEGNEAYLKQKYGNNPFYNKK